MRKIIFTKSFYALVVCCLVAAASTFSCKPRCPIKSCQTRMVHKHGSQDFRGMPWYKKQKPRIGEKLNPPSKEVKRELGQ